MSISLTEHFRNLFGFGFHPTATRAAMLLRISTQQLPGRTEPVLANDYHLCPFTTQDVLSLCIDATHVLVVDITDKGSDLSSSGTDAPTCLVVDDHRERSCSAQTTWSQSSPPKHFIFASMAYDRALDWLRRWGTTGGGGGLAIDMHSTHYSHDMGPFDACRSINIVELTLPSTVAATCVAANFLMYCTRLTHVDLSSLTNVRTIGDNFLRHCSALTSLDLSPLKNVVEVGEKFLDSCSSLTSLDLSPLANVRDIKFYFLYGCSSLTSLDLSPLSNVSVIGGSFLDGCSGLTSLDLSPLRNISDTKYYFLARCAALTSLDLSPLSNNLRQIACRFLSGCSCLISLDLSPLSNVIAIGDSFLADCSSLTSLDLSPLSNVSVIGDGFLDRCSALTSLDLSPLTNVSNFLSGCYTLDSLKQMNHNHHENCQIN
eukprot:PhM_4_TR7589/c5_g1_i3/m.99810